MESNPKRTPLEEICSLVFFSDGSLTSIIIMLKYFTVYVRSRLLEIRKSMKLLFCGTSKKFSTDVFFLIW